MDGFFYIISQEQKRKHEASIFTSTLSFKKQSSQQTQNQLPMFRKDNKKAPQVEISTTTEDNSRESSNNIKHQKVEEFTTKNMISYDQLIKMVLNLQEDVKRLKKDNKKLEGILQKQEELDLRLMSQERDLNAF